MLRSDFCGYSDAYTVVKGDITITEPDNAKNNNNNNNKNKAVAFKSNAPFINCISKVNSIKIDNAGDLDVVMPMYNLLEYSKQVLCGIIIEMNQLILFLLILNLLNIKQVLQEKLIILVLMKKVDANKVDKNETEVVIPLKYLSNFWKSLNIPVINCELELILTWSKSCI